MSQQNESIASFFRFSKRRNKREQLKEPQRSFDEELHSYRDENSPPLKSAASFDSVTWKKRVFSGDESPVVGVDLEPIKGRSLKARRSGGDTFGKSKGKTALRGSKSEGNEYMSNARKIMDTEVYRQRSFIHYDCNSLAFNSSSVASKLKFLGTRAKNATTGASTASGPAVINNEDEALKPDAGDPRSNCLVSSCPFFRNEIGCEIPRAVYFAKDTPTPRLSMVQQDCIEERISTMRNWSVGKDIYILEKYSSSDLYSIPIEHIDFGAHYYRDYFLGKDHITYLGHDESLGSIAISLLSEKATQQDVLNHVSPDGYYKIRVIFRTSELTTLRGYLLEEVSCKPGQTARHVPFKEVLSLICPQIQTSALRIASSDKRVVEKLLLIDECRLSNTYKVGIIYCLPQQTREEDMYNNDSSSDTFKEFLSLLGDVVVLKSFNKYCAQLDNKNDTCGTHSLYASYQGREIMFHVSTMIPLSSNPQISRKRHIGNDIVTVIFQEPGCQPFSPKVMKSKVQHVFIIVSVLDHKTPNERYQVAVARQKSVPPFGPALPKDGIFQKNQHFSNFILAKVINAENAAQKSRKYFEMAVRTRNGYLSDLVSKFSLPRQSSSVLGFLSSRKKERPRLVTEPHLVSSGGVSWHVKLEDYSLTEAYDAVLCLSADLFVLVDQNSASVLFHTSTSSVIAWTTKSQHLTVYFAALESISMFVSQFDAKTLEAIIDRLLLVTGGAETQSFILRRQSHEPLGLEISTSGIVTNLDSNGLAYKAGLLPKSRVVEVCNVSVLSMTHNDMLEIMRQSAVVHLTVVPPRNDGSIRLGNPMIDVQGTYNVIPYRDFANANRRPLRSDIDPMPPSGAPPQAQGIRSDVSDSDFNLSYKTALNSNNEFNEVPYNISHAKTVSTPSTDPYNPTVAKLTPAHRLISGSMPSVVSRHRSFLDSDERRCDIASDKDVSQLANYSQTVPSPKRTNIVSSEITCSQDKSKKLRADLIKLINDIDNHNQQSVDQSDNSFERANSEDSMLRQTNFHSAISAQIPPPSYSYRQLSSERVEAPLPNSRSVTGFNPSASNDLDAEWRNLVETARHAVSLPHASETTSDHKDELINSLKQQLSEERTVNSRIRYEYELLQQENERLQNESNTANMKLRKLTAWFANNNNKI